MGFQLKFSLSLIPQVALKRKWCQSCPTLWPPWYHCIVTAGRSSCSPLQKPILAKQVLMKGKVVYSDASHLNKPSRRLGTQRHKAHLHLEVEVEVFIRRERESRTKRSREGVEKFSARR